MSNELLAKVLYGDPDKIEEDLQGFFNKNHPIVINHIAQSIICDQHRNKAMVTVIYTYADD